MKLLNMQRYSTSLSGFVNWGEKRKTTELDCILKADLIANRLMKTFEIPYKEPMIAAECWNGVTPTENTELNLQFCFWKNCDGTNQGWIQSSLIFF